MATPETEDELLRANILWARREPEGPGAATGFEEASRRGPGRGEATAPGAARREGHTDSTSQIAARRSALRALNADGVPYVVAGAYAMREYTDIFRDTKDLDVFCRRQDLDRLLNSLESCGFRVERTDPLWIAKGFAADGEFVDVIFSSGNGVAEVDDLWHARSREAKVLGVPVRIAAPEEIIWSKAYVLERERYDGADIHHLIRFAPIDWSYLLWRMGSHGEVLLAHLVLFRFAFPGEREKVPDWVLEELFAQARRGSRPEERALCRGTLLSSVQYRSDVDAGLRDSRLLEVTSWKEHRLGS